MSELPALDGPPERWIPRGGRPAACLDGHEGMPSYESDDGRIVVFETSVAFASGQLTANAAMRDGRGARHAATGPPTPVFLPASYGRVAVRHAILDPDCGLVPLHDEPGADWAWRPLLYELRAEGYLQRFGSQNEIEWRNGLAESQARRHDRDEAVTQIAVDFALSDRDRVDDGTRPLRERADDIYAELRAVADARIAELEARPWRYVEANKRARAILLEHLSPQQRLDLAAHQRFFVRGTMNELYAIQPGNGLAVVDPATREPRTSLCLHMESWMPHDDVALAHKLLIESGPDGEAELLAAARPYPQIPPRPATRADRYARDAERYLDPVTPA